MQLRSSRFITVASCNLGHRLVFHCRKMTILIFLLLVLRLSHKCLSAITLSTISAINLNSANRYMPLNCVFHFLEFDPLVDYSQLGMIPRSITQLVECYLNRSFSTKISRHMELICAYTFVLLPRSPHGLIKWLRNGGKSYAIYPGRAFGNAPKRYHTISHTIVFLQSSGKMTGDVSLTYSLLPLLSDRSKALPIFVLFYEYDGCCILPLI